ncbi:hypothetical protein Q8F55_005668 [Vanrija albida]|uniref:L-serine ammonia-lyase n=1 Tax=Vanrija albida TaxID=181172 RepID=A0ABR3Q295_9TREE
MLRSAPRRAARALAPRLSLASRPLPLPRRPAPLARANSTAVAPATPSMGSIPVSELPPSQRPGAEDKPRAEHAVISTFDLFSIGIGPSSSHTVGPMRAAKIFTYSIPKAMHKHVHSLKVSLHGSLAATGMGHMTPHAVLLGLMGEDPEHVEVGRLGRVLDEVRAVGEVDLGLDHGAHKRVKFDLDRDMTWHLNPLPAHPNGVVFTVFDKNGDMLATNEYFSVGGGFVVNKETQTANQNLYYRETHAEDATPARRDQGQGLTPADGLLPAITDGRGDGNAAELEGAAEQPKRLPYIFATAEELLAICERENLTIAQVVWENERAFRSEADIETGLMALWETMDACIRNGVTSSDKHLPGGLNVRRRAPGLYKRLQQGFYPSVGVPRNPALGPGTDVEAAPKHGKRTGRPGHYLELVPKHTRPVFPGIEYLSCMAIAVNEVNASGGRVVTAPTNGAAGVIPATLKYVTEFISQNAHRDIMTFLLTASAVGMLFKRGATISAAEGGCMAEVGVACSMAAAGLTAILGAEPSVILQAAEIGIEHNLGLTCDPLGGLVQVPCIERNSLGAVKAVTAAQLAMAGSGEHTVSLDDAIEACRTTAMDMHSHYKETSLGGLAASVKIPLSSPAC